MKVRYNIEIQRLGDLRKEDHGIKFKEPLSALAYANTRVARSTNILGECNILTFSKLGTFKYTLTVAAINSVVTSIFR